MKAKISIKTSLIKANEKNKTKFGFSKKSSLNRFNNKILIYH